MSVVTYFWSKDIYIDQIEKTLIQNIDTLSIVFKNKNDMENITEIVHNLHEKLNLRITIIDEDGVVIADSDKINLAQIDNHLNRKEIIEAKNNEIGRDTRKSETIDKELCARVKAVIKRTSKDIDILKVKDIVYKSSNKKFYIDDVEIDLTHLEHDLLLEFVKNKDILMTREHLLNSVWEDSFEKKEKTVNVAIKRLKAKIDPDGKKDYIHSIRGEGYIFC